MSTNIRLTRKIATIFAMTLLIFACSMILGSKAYAATTPNITGVKAGYEAVYLSWEAVDGASGYDVICNNDGAVYDAGTATSYKAKFDPFPSDLSGVARKASFTVRARGTGAEATVSDIDVVHPMYVVLTTKGKTKLYTGAKSKKVGATLGKGQKIIAYGGSRQDTKNKRMLVKFGPYGKTYWVKVGDVKKGKYVYNSKTQYSAQQVLDFVNDRGVKPVKTGSKGKNYGYNMIWVNTYHQRLYLLTWDGSQWTFHKRYPNGLLANTGKELTPYGLFKVSSKWDKKPQTGTKWWCIFNGVGVHQQLRDKLGKPLSGGCVRIKTSEAKWFFQHIGKKTPVLVY